MTTKLIGTQTKKTHAQSLNSELGSILNTLDSTPIYCQLSEQMVMNGWATLVILNGRDLKALGLSPTMQALNLQSQNFSSVWVLSLEPHQPKSSIRLTWRLILKFQGPWKNPLGHYSGLNWIKECEAFRKGKNGMKCRRSSSKRCAITVSKTRESNSVSGLR